MKEQDDNYHVVEQLILRTFIAEKTNKVHHQVKQ